MLENIRNRFQSSEKSPLFSENKMQAQSQGGIERVQEEMERRATHIGYGLGVGLRRYLSVFLENMRHFSMMLKRIFFSVSSLEKQQVQIQSYLKEHFSQTKYVTHQLKDFMYFSQKMDGVSEGGIYKDSEGVSWLIKQPQFIAV